MNSDTETLRKACCESLHFLCTQFLGFGDWDKVHDDLEILLNKPSRKKLILIPRGHLKTAIITKGYAIQCLLKNPNVRILIANQVWDKAREILYEIKQLLTDKSNLSKLFGSFISSRWREDDVVIAQRSRAFAAPTIGTSGVEAEMTSSHYDVIILDDLQGLQNYQTPEQREKVKRYYRSMMDLLEPGGQLLVVGTRWHLDDVYQYILDNESEYFDVTVRRVVEDGKIIFPKKFNKKFNPQLKCWEKTDVPCMDYIDYLRKRPSEEFSAQYMNQPIDAENQIFKPAYFKYYNQRPQRLYVAMTIDPAISEKQSADYFAINVSGMDENYNIYILDTLKGHWKLSESIDNIFTTYQKWRPSSVGLETIAYQKALKAWLEEKMRERGIFFPITELRRSTNETKEFRVKALEPFYREGKIFHAPWMKSLELELVSFPKGKHDDECFVAGTKIATVSGDKNIEQIRVGDCVITPFGTRKVLANRQTGVKPVITRCGMEATANHPVFSGDEFVPLDTLTYQLDNCKLSLGGLIQWKYKRLLNLMEHSTVLWGRESIISASHVPIAEEGTLKDFMLRFGNFITKRKLRQAFIFTIKTATLLTTTYLTWNVYRLGNTIRFLNVSIKKRCGKILNALDRLLQSGMDRKKVLLGINNTVSINGKKQERRISPARFVESLLNHLCQMLFIVPSLVRQDFGELQELTMSPVFAQSVGGNSQVINIHTLRPVPSDAEPFSTTAIEKPVYNLTVEKDHVYFANGNLVSNCDALASQLELLVPGDPESVSGMPTGCWEEAAQAARASQMGKKDFFHERVDAPRETGKSFWDRINP